MTRGGAVTPAEADLAAIAARVEWPDAEAAAAARAEPRSDHGRLDELYEWLAGVRGSYPPRPLARPRCVVIGADAPPAGLADSLGVGVRVIAPPDVGEAFAAGARLADDEVDSGTDLLIVAADGSSPSLAAVVSMITAAEPVSLLPRGAAAVDTAAWIAQAQRVRDLRRRVVDLRHQQRELLVGLGDAALALATGVVLHAAARRTPLILDGTVAVVAGLLANDLTGRAGRWWQIADTGSDPVHSRAVAAFDATPLLDLKIATGSGTAGVLTVALLRAAEENRT